MTYNSQSDNVPKIVSFKKFVLQSAMSIPIISKQCRILLMDTWLNLA